MNDPLDYRSPATHRRRSWFLPTKNAKRLLIAAAVITAISLTFGVVGALSWYLTFSRNMKSAESQATKLNAAVANDPRFADVRFIASSTNNGELFIDGSVRSQKDLIVLQQIVSNSNPNTRIAWKISVPAGNTAQGIARQHPSPAR